MFSLERQLALTVRRVGKRKGCSGHEKTVKKGENYSLEKTGNTVCYGKRKMAGEDA